MTTFSKRLATLRAVLPSSNLAHLETAEPESTTVSWRETMAQMATNVAPELRDRLAFVHALADATDDDVALVSPLTVSSSILTSATWASLTTWMRFACTAPERSSVRQFFSPRRPQAAWPHFSDAGSLRAGTSVIPSRGLRLRCASNCSLGDRGWSPCLARTDPLGPT